MKTTQITTLITPRNTRSVNLLLNEIKDFEVLSKDEEVSIFERYSITKDKKLLDEITEKNVRFVVSIAKQYMHYKNVTLEDLISVGSIGLIKAANKFDTSKGFKFISYAVFHIRGEIMNYVANNGNMIRIPLNINTRYVLAQKKLSKDEELSDSELASIEYKSNTRVSSLNDTIGEDTTLIDIIENKNSDSPLKDLYQEDKTVFILHAVNSLRQKEADIIKSLFGLDGHECKDLNEVAEEYGVSIARITAIKKMAYFKLKRRIKSNGFVKTYNSIME